jgi:hypothetical protein
MKNQPVAFEFDYAADHRLIRKENDLTEAITAALKNYSGIVKTASTLVHSGNYINKTFIRSLVQTKLRSVMYGAGQAKRAERSGLR